MATLNSTPAPVNAGLDPSWVAELVNETFGEPFPAGFDPEWDLYTWELGAGPSALDSAEETAYHASLGEHEADTLCPLDLLDDGHPEAYLDLPRPDYDRLALDALEHDRAMSGHFAW
jgi:hypothetical protein